LRFKPIREFEVAIDFGTIKTNKHPAKRLDAKPVQ
jgi:hypothetical protein